MITIIKKGTRQTKECEDCGCVFSFDAEDIEIQSNFSDGFRKIIRCPQCESVILLESTR